MLRLLAAFTLAASICDQGAPGRQGPWAVAVVPNATSIISKANATATLGALSVAGSSCDSSRTTVVAGVSAGLACAVSGPTNANFTFQCIAGAGIVTWKFCNAAITAQNTTAGDYTAVVF